MNSSDSTIYRLLRAACIPLAIFLFMPLAPICLPAQSAIDASATVTTYATGDTLVAAGAQYAASTLHRLLFGSLHRAEWLQQVRVPVLDLARTAGGLTPLRSGGGFQTLSLRFQAADGRQYKFRSMDKYPAGLLPEELRNTFVADVLQDFISTAHPYGSLVASPILRACGVLNAEPRLVVLPDDARLDSFRTTYARRFGTFEIHPDDADNGEAGFAGADKVVGTITLLEKMQKATKDRIDARAYLKARLLDVFMGDWDRHTDQWRWARFGNDRIDLWQPIPRDRDQAFCRYDGLIPWIVTIVVPQIESCDDTYPQMQYLTYSGRHLDRRVLTALDWENWADVIEELRQTLTDSLLAAAAERLPISTEDSLRYSGSFPVRADMIALFRNRRSGLELAAQEWYRLLVAEAEVHCSDEDEYVEILRHDNGDVTVSARPIKPGKRTADEARFFSRRFAASETDEIRIHLHDGDDHCALDGTSDAAILIRIIGGDGRDTLTDRSVVQVPLLGFIPVRVNSQANVFYDSGGGSVITRGPSTEIDRASVRKQESLEERFEPSQRDWGSEWLPALLGGWNADLGVLLGGGATYTRYGFRSEPYAWRFGIRAGITPMSYFGKAVLNLECRALPTGAWLHVDAGISGYEVVYYFGVGNESIRREDAVFSYAVRQTQVFLRPTLHLPLWKRLEGSLGLSARLVTSDLDDEQLYLGIVKPFGYEQTALADLHVSLAWDSRDHASWPTSGFYLRLDGAYFPGVLDLPTGFGSASADVRGYFTSEFPFPGTLALRAGGRRVWGEYPFFESAFLGGLSSARGYEINRFAGDASAYATAELRVPVTRYHLVFPTELGILGFVESGRVFVEGEHSRRWHVSFGGGLWIAPVYRDFTVSASVGISDDHIRFDLDAGFAF